MNKCKGCVYWKWIKADKLYQTPGYHYCEKNKETTCKRRAGEKEHYRITIDVIAEPDGVDRCSDIDHVVYLNKNELVPWTVRAEDVKHKVELLSDEAQKNLELTWKDMRAIRIIKDHLTASINGPMWDSKEFYEEILRRFNKAKDKE